VERETVHRVVEQRQLASFANNTRWNNVFSKLLNHGLRVRLKHVAWAETSDWSAWLVPAKNYLEVVSAGPVHFREIEWVEFDCACGDIRLEECVAAARESKLMVEVVNQYVRVFGYRQLSRSA